MHLCLAASLDAPCWPCCWAIADQAKAATESAIAKKSLLLIVHFLSVGYRDGTLPIVLRRPTDRPLEFSPDKGVGFFLILFGPQRAPDPMQAAACHFSGENVQSYALPRHRP
jgi:hypothetical protein